MAAPHSRLTAQGQISVPSEIRRRLGIGPGSVLEWETNGDQVIVRRLGQYSSADIHGALFTRPPKRHTLTELKAALARHVRDRHARR